MIRIIKGKHLFIIKSIIKTAVNMKVAFIKTSKRRSKNLFFTNFGKNCPIIHVTQDFLKTGLEKKEMDTKLENLTML